VVFKVKKNTGPGMATKVTFWAGKAEAPAAPLAEQSAQAAAPPLGLPAAEGRVTPQVLEAGERLARRNGRRLHDGPERFERHRSWHGVLLFESMREERVQSSRRLVS
jgi:hypothetical protein